MPRRNRRRSANHFPIAAILLTAAALTAGIAVILSPDPNIWFQRYGLVPGTFWSDDGIPWYRSREWLTPVTALFLHLDWLHLFGNLAFFWLFAQRIERRTGALWFLILVLGCGALANLVSAWRFPASASPVIGASGATAALLGAFLVLDPTARLGIILPLGLYWQLVRVPGIALIGSWFLLQVLYTVSSTRVEEIAWWSHIGGFLAGFILAALGRVTRSMQR
ncbi:MAG: rhomboid family intramembrane serine protease [Xanthomonadales bacterium]|nr:rhomboid family intramembrane serine protease [Xanthomonadales bacterium]